MMLNCAGRRLDLSRPVVMGILNVTPDSFSDGGRFLGRAEAVAHARRMVEDGASIIDVGGESTRPGASAVSVQQELDRVIPVIEALRAEVDVTLSVDTSKPEVMTAATSAGAGMLNDVRALREPGALAAAAASGLPICLMHMLGEPRSMQTDPRYQDVVSEVGEFLDQRVAACVAAGIPRERLILDPGFGFGKTLAHNLSLLAGIDRLAARGLAVLVGVSRKSMFGQLLDAPVERRLAASLAAATLALAGGAHIIRCHDVRPHRDAIEVFAAVQTARTTMEDVEARS